MTIQELIFDFLKELSDFSYETDSLDRVWQILFPDKDGAWHHVRVTHYRACSGVCIAAPGQPAFQKRAGGV
jgi:hypothetical protein